MQNYVLVLFQKRKVVFYKNFEGSVTFNYSNIDVYNIHTKFLHVFWMKAHKWSLLEQWRMFEFEFTCKSWPWEKINYCIYQRVKEFSCRLNLVSTTDCTHSRDYAISVVFEKFLCLLGPNCMKNHLLIYSYLGLMNAVVKIV